MNLLLFIVAIGISFVVVRIGAVAFNLTGMAWSQAKFQALSCFSGTGFSVVMLPTTGEFASAFAFARPSSSFASISMLSKSSARSLISSSWDLQPDRASAASSKQQIPNLMRTPF